MRAALVIAHRWAGLTIALFLVIAGVTGSALPFLDELSSLCASRLWAAAPPTPGAQPLSGPALAMRVEAATGGQVAQAPLRVDGRRAVALFVFAAPGRPKLPFDQVVVDPYNGRIRDHLRFGEVQALPRDLPTFLLGLHYGYVAGPWGRLAFGAAALVWLVDAFVGLALTFPRRRRNAPPRPPPEWLARWRPAWVVRRHARGHRLTFDLHQATGLWFWPVALVFAWSAFGMNLPAVHDPLVRALGSAEARTPPALPEPLARPKLDYAAAARRGEALMHEAAEARGFQILAPSRLDYRAAQGAYRYTAATTLDVADGAATSIWLNATDGRGLAFVPPSAAAVDRLGAWADALHEAQVFGLPWRIVTSAFGLLVTGLTVTGVMIWMKKRAAREANRPTSTRRSLAGPGRPAADAAV